MMSRKRYSKRKASRTRCSKPIFVTGRLKATNRTSGSLSRPFAAPLPDHERLFASALLPNANSGRPAPKGSFHANYRRRAGLAGLNGVRLLQAQDNTDNTP